MIRMSIIRQVYLISYYYTICQILHLFYFIGEKDIMEYTRYIIFTTNYTQWISAQSKLVFEVVFLTYMLL